MKVIDDIFVFTDMQRDEFFICYCLCFNIFCTIGVFESIYGLLKLTAWRADVNDHNCLAVAS